MESAKRTDLSTVVGITLALFMVLAAIAMGGNVRSFVDVPSVLIVVGGTLAITTACFSFPEMLRAQGLVLKTVSYTSEHPSKLAIRLLELAEEGRKNGLLGLQTWLNSVRERNFLTKGLMMIVDGMDVEAVEKILRQDMQSMMDRHAKSVAVLRKSAEIAPAMGLIGTLIGLVQMLGNLNDPSSIGPAMAVALLTTLYGAMLAYMVFSPLASKLERNSREEVLVQHLCLKGVMSIGRKENPRRLEMLLNTILPPEQRVHYFN